MVNERLRCWRYDHLEGCPSGYRCSILVEDSPFLFVGAFVPNTDVVIVGCTPSVFPIRALCDEHDGVRVAVNGGVADVGVVAAAVRVRGGVGEHALLVCGCALGVLVGVSLAGGSLTGVSVLGIAGCLEGCAFG